MGKKKKQNKKQNKKPNKKGNDRLISLLIIIGLVIFLICLLLVKAVYYIFNKGTIIDDKKIKEVFEKIWNVFKKW